MTLRCSFMTSSYLRTSLRISALRPSTVFWARSMALETIFASIGTSSGIVRSITHETAPVAKSRKQVVFERQEEATLAGVALATRTTAQLVVDSTRVVALGAEHVESTQGADLVALGLAHRHGTSPAPPGRRRRTPRCRLEALDPAPRARPVPRGYRRGSRPRLDRPCWSRR